MDVLERLGEAFETTMTHAVTGAGTAVTARARYQIEEDWDYAYLEATTNGTDWTPLETNLSRDENPNNQNDGNGITGTTNGAWVDLTATAPAGTTAIRFRYWTDPFTNGQGFFVDNITYGGQSIGTAETDEGWVFEHSWQGDPPAPARSRSSAHQAGGRGRHDPTSTSRRTASTTGTTRRWGRRTTSGSWAPARTGWRPTRT